MTLAQCANSERRVNATVRRGFSLDRVVVLAVGWLITLSALVLVHILLKWNDQLRKKLERCSAKLTSSLFVASWTGVIKYHGPRPSMQPKQVFVANHTSMIDFIILNQMTTFAVIMQKQTGWVGLLQSTIMESLGCIWFDCSEAKDHEIVARKLRDHVNRADNNPLLIFPEGTCENNQYGVMFKKAILHNASTAAYDVMDCCLRCVVLEASKYKSWRDTYRICRKVPNILL